MFQRYQCKSYIRKGDRVIAVGNDVRAIGMGGLSDRLPSMGKTWGRVSPIFAGSSSTTACAGAALVADCSTRPWRSWTKRISLKRIFGPSLARPRHNTSTSLIASNASRRDRDANGDEDAFGFSELVFAVSHLLGFSYAPRFKNLPRQRLYIFRNRKGVDRSAWKIKPAGYADDEIVIQQWDEILRMIATIKLKEVTASDLFRRLNFYSKQHALHRALKAFGQIPKSLFILQVIDDPVLRHAIEKQMDRIEHVHRFRRAVSVGNPSRHALLSKRSSVCRNRQSSRCQTDISVQLSSA